MRIRRTIVWVVSSLFGIVAAAGLIVYFHSDFNEFTVGLFPGDLPLVLLLLLTTLSRV